MGPDGERGRMGAKGRSEDWREPALGFKMVEGRPVRTRAFAVLGPLVLILNLRVLLPEV